ncbi:MYO18B [Cordylochernes scorpioides]|uniref:MYO18B n=1 Tax=Cordylochernes scorpioides TaxID=51811 RepID=A0ABY6LAR0_9ARAC|nr:MYO18B [Cordylochernes scorpioides]
MIIMLCEALEDLDEERKVASQWKRKAQKLTSEMQDLRLSLEEQMVRNAELEKRQRKFDSELVASQEELRKEVAARERLEREREAYAGVKYSLEQELQATKQDLSTYMEKVALLTREMDELTLSSQGEEEVLLFQVTQLKRGRQEVERKLAEAEEELEEQAGQVTMLEQAKLRLEMTLEKCRQEFRRDLANKEDEIDDLRATYMKKMILVKDAQKFQRTDENVQKITDLIKENPRTTLLELEQDTGISKTTIGRIVTEDLKLKKTPAKFIPRFLTNEQKLCRLATCEDMMEMTRTDPEWKDKIITGDETWMKNMEAQLEAEQEERHQLARQRHELERRISELQEALASRQQSAGNRETVQRLRRDLKCTRALLADAQLMLERSRSGDPASKTLIRQLRNQVEDAEMARSAALKSRQGTQQELEELQAQLEDISRTKQEAESRVTQLARERTSLLSQLEEAEEELVALTNKHRAVLQQAMIIMLAAEQGRMALQAQQVEELEMERQSLRDQLAEAAVRLEQLSGATEKASQAHRMEAKLREVESRLEMEQLSLSRLQSHYFPIAYTQQFLICRSQARMKKEEGEQ